MNTLKWIRRAKKHFLIFAAACAVSNIGFYLNQIMPYDLFFGVGLCSMLLWAINPLPLIYSVIGLLCYCIDRKCEDYRTIIGRKCLLLPAILLGSIILYCLSAGIMVELTGGA